MAKMHTREKRKKGLPTNRSYNQKKRKFNGRKTWKSKEQAAAWAKDNDIDDPTILKKGSKYIVQEQERTLYSDYHG